MNAAEIKQMRRCTLLKCYASSTVSWMIIILFHIPGDIWSAAELGSCGAFSILERTWSLEVRGGGIHGTNAVEFYSLPLSASFDFFFRSSSTLGFFAF